MLSIPQRQLFRQQCDAHAQIYGACLKFDTAFVPTIEEILLGGEELQVLTYSHARAMSTSGRTSRFTAAENGWIFPSDI